VKSFDVPAAKWADGSEMTPEIRIVGNCDHAECRDSVSGNTIQIQQGDQTITIAESQIMAVHNGVLRSWTFL
jgi:hypothetical protein